MQRSKLIPLTLLVASVNLTTYAQDDTSATSAVDTSTTEASTTNTNNANAKKTTWDVKEVSATKHWVSDRLETPLRSCPSEKCRVVKVVRPGFEITQIGVTSDGWALVTVGELKGYLPKRYIQDTPVASQQLEGAQRQSLE
ncbi:MAG: hypothetical protein K0U21_03970, partial [Proteobacteria bacterium]|nr:hypothetical protein [Pseudomonadota bacterium]